MAERRSSIDDVLTLEQYRDLLRTGARIEDRVESITIVFFLLMLGRVGLRIGEAIHMTEEWYHEDRSVIVVPGYVDCDCGLCRHYADRLASDNEDLSVEEAREKYWSPKDGSSRQVPIETEREREIIELYFAENPYTQISYSTVLRRLKKIGELTEGVDGSRMYGHMLRATAATHYAWAGLRLPTLDLIFGWQDEKTKERYVEKTGFRASRDLTRIRSTTSDDRFKLRPTPPTYTEMRPESADDLLTVETWTPESDVPSHPRYVDDEEWLQKDLGEYTDDGRVPSVTDPIMASVSTGHVLMHKTASRLRTEWNAVRDESAVWPTPREAAAPLLKSGLGLVMLAVLFSIVGFTLNPVTGELSYPPAGVGGGIVLGVAMSIWQILWADYRARIEDIAFTRWLGQSLPVDPVEYRNC